MIGLGWEKAPARLALGYTSRSSVLIKASCLGAGVGGDLGRAGGTGVPAASHQPCAHCRSHAASWGGGGQEGHGPGGCRRRGP